MFGEKPSSIVCFLFLPSTWDLWPATSPALSILFLPPKSGPNAYLTQHLDLRVQQWVFTKSIDITVNIRVHASIIVSLSRASGSLELFSGNTLKDLGEGYLEPPSGIEFGIGISIRQRSIVDLTSDPQVEEVKDYSLNNGESSENPQRASILVDCILGTLANKATLEGVP